MFGGLFKKKDNKMILGAPVKGKAVPLSEVNDPTFAWYLIHSMQSALYLKKGQRF